MLLTPEGKTMIRRAVLTSVIIVACVWFFAMLRIDPSPDDKPQDVEHVDRLKPEGPRLEVRTNINISPSLDAYIKAMRTGARARELTHPYKYRGDALIDVIYYPPNNTLYGVFVVRGQPDYEHGYTSFSGPRGTWLYTESRNYGPDIWQYYYEKRTPRIIGR